MHPRLKLLVILISISGLPMGCSSTKESVLPQDGPSMKAIYEAHVAAMGAEDAAALRRELGSRPLADDERDLAGYARSAETELDTIFPRLPNPTLVMYVFPHLSGRERLPVPGYATRFSLYERDEYALPGEVPGATP
jgi:conjugative transfer region lipoprotein (TIGR03751 family)